MRRAFWWFCLIWSFGGLALADSELPTLDPQIIPEGFRTFVHFEANFNSYERTFDTTPFYLEAIEFPVGNQPNLHVLNSYWDWLMEPAGIGKQHSIIIDVDPLLPEKTKEFLFYQRNGQTYARWPIHPKDKSLFKVISQYLTDREIPFQIRKYLIGQMTASRALILTQPETGYTISDKPSTDGTSQGGSRSDGSQFRPYPIRWAHLARRLSDFYKQMEPYLTTLKIAYEPMMIGFPPNTTSDGKVVDQANSIRLMDELNEPGIHHVSGFVIDSPSGLEELSRLSGWPRRKLRAVLGEIYGRAMVEMNIVLGFRYGSAHGQNIRFEFDANWTPTGRVIILDLTDGYPFEAVWRLRGQQELLQQWEKLVENPIQTDNEFTQQKFVHGLNSDYVLRGARSRFHELTGRWGLNIQQQPYTHGALMYHFRNQADFEDSLDLTSRSSTLRNVLRCMGFLQPH